MYIVQELQTTNGTTALLAALTYDNKENAESAMHMALASAAISSVDIHTVMLYNEFGRVIRTESYDHVNGKHEFTIQE